MCNLQRPTNLNKSINVKYDQWQKGTGLIGTKKMESEFNKEINQNKFMIYP